MEYSLVELPPERILQCCPWLLIAAAFNDGVEATDSLE
jgi:hypothetical protein